MKEFNVKRHYETCHSKYKEYVGERRKLKIKNLKSGFEQQTNLRRNKKKENQLQRQHWLLVLILIIFPSHLIKVRDACDTAQLTIFIRGITGNFDVIEKFAELIPIKSTTRREDIAQAILECTGRMQLDLSKFVSATTDVTPAMVGPHKGAIAVLQNHVASLGFSNTIIKLQCINSSGSFGIKGYTFGYDRFSVCCSLNYQLCFGKRPKPPPIQMFTGRNECSVSRSGVFLRG